MGGRQMGSVQSEGELVYKKQVDAEVGSCGRQRAEGRLPAHPRARRADTQAQTDWEGEFSWNQL